MTKIKQKSKDLKSWFRLTDNTSVVVGTLIGTFIATTPYLFYLYESVPDQKVWDTLLFTYDSNYYGSALTVAWTLTGKIVPLLLILIWFFTCRHWWYHVLIVPIAMYSFQVFTILNDDLNYVDSNQILYLIPIMAVIVPSIYLVRAKMFNKLNTANKSFQELEDEFMFKPTTIWGKIKQYF